MKHQNPGNYDFNTIKKESSIKPSRTVPSQTLSIQTILERHTRGQGLGVAVKEGIYSNSDHPIPDVKSMDLAETEEMIDNLKNNSQKMIEEFESRKKTKEKDEKELQERRERDRLNQTPLEKEIQENELKK